MARLASSSDWRLLRRETLVLPSSNSAAAVRVGGGQGSGSEQKGKKFPKDYGYIRGFYRIWDATTRMNHGWFAGQADELCLLPLFLALQIVIFLELCIYYVIFVNCKNIITFI